jgi:hypothetical protein
MLGTRVGYDHLTLKIVGLLDDCPKRLNCSYRKFWRRLMTGCKLYVSHA